MTAIEELQWPPAAGKGSDEAPDENEDELDRTRSIAPCPARFDIMLEGKLISEFDLPLGRVVIGRTQDNDLQIASKFVSRHHAQITTTPEVCLLEDLNSTNGVFIDSGRVKRHELVDGDVIHLGEHKLVYRDLRSGTSALRIIEDAAVVAAENAAGDAPENSGGDAARDAVEEAGYRPVFEQAASGGEAD